MSEMTDRSRSGAVSRADARRAQILEAAHTCFSREGLHGASMASMAAEAGLSVGQIYRYFENKEAVIAALCEVHLEEWSQRLAAARARSDDVVEEMIEMARYNCEKLEEPGAIAMVLEFFSEAARNQRIGALVCAVDEAARARLRELLARPGEDAAAAMARASMATILLEGWLLRVLKDPGASKEDYLASLRPMFRLLVQGA